MSRVHVYRLLKIQGEYDAVRQATGFLLQNFNSSQAVDYTNAITQTMLKEAAGNLEKTYFIRLYAEFEGILKDHLVSNYPSLAFLPEDKPRVDQVIERVGRGEGLNIDPNLRRNLDAARDYRNSIAHTGRMQVSPIAIQEGLALLGRFVGLLSEPRI